MGPMPWVQAVPVPMEHGSPSLLKLSLTNRWAQLFLPCGAGLAMGLGVLVFPSLCSSESLERLSQGSNIEPCSTSHILCG